MLKLINSVSGVTLHQLDKRIQVFVILTLPEIDGCQRRFVHPVKPRNIKNSLQMDYTQLMVLCFSEL